MFEQTYQTNTINYAMMQPLHFKEIAKRDKHLENSGLALVKLHKDILFLSFV